MIFVTVGSHEPFDRLIKAVDEWASKHAGMEVVAQTTNKGRYRPQYIKALDYMTEQIYRDVCIKAEVLVAHAGMGSIITALSNNKSIVIMARYHRLNEQRNDHQVATANRFRGRPGIFVADDESSLGAAIEQAIASNCNVGRLSPFASESLTSFLRREFEK